MASSIALILLQNSAMANGLAEAFTGAGWRAVASVADRMAVEALSSVPMTVSVIDEALILGAAGAAMMRIIRRTWPWSGMVVCANPRVGREMDTMHWIAQGADRVSTLDADFSDVVNAAEDLREMGYGTAHRKPRLLLVEDQATLRTALQSELQDRGLVVDVGATAEEGLEHLRSARMDLVVTDIFMPGMGGIALMEEITGRRLNTPVIAMSAGAGGNGDIASKALRAARKLGAVETIQKSPTLAEDLVAAIQRQLPTWTPKTN